MPTPVRHVHRSGGSLGTTPYFAAAVSSPGPARGGSTPPVRQGRCGTGRRGTSCEPGSSAACKGSKTAQQSRAGSKQKFSSAVSLGMGGSDVPQQVRTTARAGHAWATATAAASCPPAGSRSCTAPYPRADNRQGVLVQCDCGPEGAGWARSTVGQARTRRWRCSSFRREYLPELGRFYNPVVQSHERTSAR